MGKTITITIYKGKPPALKQPGSPVIRARSTRDAYSLASLYDDLANRMAAALADLLEGEKGTKDEKEGHEFHGNQYVDVPGSPKPTTTVAKIAKHAVHELLSSGHPFTIEELGAITGHANPKTLAAWMTMFKSPKYAGPKGVLDIKKLPDGSYQVIKPDGEPAGVNPKLAEVKEANAAIKEEQGYLSEMKPPKGYVPTQVKPPPEPHPDLPDGSEPLGAMAVHPETGEALHHVVGGLILVPKTPIPHADADDDYKDNLMEAQASLAGALETGMPTPAKAEALVLGFKQEKALFMAQWKTNTTAKFHEPKKQEVFKADKQLVDDLVAAANLHDPMDDPDGYGAATLEAFAKWKANTKLEKMGKFPPGASPAPVKAEPVKEPPAPALTHEPVKPIPYHSLVPDHHEPISPDDFTGTTSLFEKGMKGLKSFLASKSASATANKSTVEKTLRGLLKDSPNFHALRSLIGDHVPDVGPQSLESRLVATWAGSSGGANPLSNAMQLAVRDAFSIPDDHVTKTQLKVIKASSSEDEVFKKGLTHLSPASTIPDKHLPVFRKALQEFAHAQYKATQALFKEHGVSHVYLARGMKVSGPSADLKAGPVNLKLQPASSFSVNYSTAKAFGGGGHVFLTKVPVSQVLSTYMSGFGCTGEHEVVVLAHEKLKSYHLPASLTGSLSDAAELVANKLGIQKKAKAAA